jgi:hypothetical protein
MPGGAEMPGGADKPGGTAGIPGGADGIESDVGGGDFGCISWDPASDSPTLDGAGECEIRLFESRFGLCCFVSAGVTGRGGRLAGVVGRDEGREDDACEGALATVDLLALLGRESILVLSLITLRV